MAALLLVSLAGCANHYQITTTDGLQYTTNQAPKFHMGVYTFEDVQGVAKSVSFMKVKAVSKL